MTSAPRYPLVLLLALLIGGCGGRPGEAVVDVGREACKPHGGLNSAENTLRVWDAEFQCKNGVLIMWRAVK